MRKRLITWIAAALAGTLSLHAQNLTDLVLSEAQVRNETGIVDGNGVHSPWVEITNSSQGTVNYAGCFLSDDPDNLRKYMIPKGVITNRLGARQVTVIFPDFPLQEGSTVYLTSTDGKTVIDTLRIPEGLPADKSVRKMARDNKKIRFLTDPEPAEPSPGRMNSDGVEETGAQRVARTDPHGGVLTLTSVSVVFCALLVLLIIFSITGGIFSGKFKRTPKKKASDPDAETAAAIALALSLEGGSDEAAAVALALHLYLSESVHDGESYVITLKKQPSAWDDKTRMFRKKTR